ncbi:RNA polymerase II degradation factor 1-like [Athalia rosae]|uniref:RNA polymerase II degradation factor 1-like n=1 Tax=Athalia rosae TaxID=37344 RepID=UPI0020342F06|nr:RNA polymerase II degradation factor 1-like [Athalia rosae]
MKVFLVLAALVALAVAETPVYRQQNQQQRRYYFARQEENTTPYTPSDGFYPPSGWKPDGPSFYLPQRQVETSYGSPSEPSSNPEQQYGAPDVPQPVQPLENRRQQQPQQPQQQQQQQQQQFGASQNSNQGRRFLAPVFQPEVNRFGVPQPRGQFQPRQPEQEYGVPVTTTTEEPSTTTTEIEDSTTTLAPQTADSEVEPVNSVNELDDEEDIDNQQQREMGEYYIALPDGRLQRIRYVSHQDIEAMKYFARIRAENVEPLRGPIYSYSPLQEVRFNPATLNVAAQSAPAGSSTSSGKLELQDEAAAPSPPLAAVVRYPFNVASPVVPLGAAVPASGYSSNYRVQAPETRYLLSF